jgi:hypothetical protein
MLKYKDLTPDLILNYFPELKRMVENQIAFWETEEVPAHCLYGDTFNLYLSALLHYNQETDMIRRIFVFYEFLATEGDAEVQNLVQTTLLEYLWDYSHIYQRALSFMGEYTRKLNEEISVFLNKPKNDKREKDIEKFQNYLNQVKSLLSDVHIQYPM